MTFREFVRWASNEGWSRKEVFAMARLWWKLHPDDRGDFGVFEIFYRGKRLPGEFHSRRAAVKWGLWNYKGRRAGWQVRPVSFEYLGEPYMRCPLCAPQHADIRG